LKGADLRVATHETTMFERATTIGMLSNDSADNG
jgi:hypothetical protein